MICIACGPQGTTGTVPTVKNKNNLFLFWFIKHFKLNKVFINYYLKIFNNLKLNSY